MQTKTQNASEAEAPIIENLKMWLIGRESDIAYSIEDFGGLQDVFVYFIGREPKE